MERFTNFYLLYTSIDPPVKMKLDLLIEGNLNVLISCPDMVTENCTGSMTLVYQRVNEEDEYSLNLGPRTLMRCLDALVL